MIKLSKWKTQKFQDKLLSWGENNFQDFPWRKKNPYYILTAEMMLHKTQAQQVIPIFERFISKYPSLKCLKKSSKKEVKKILSPLGLNWRIESFYKTIKIILQNYNAKVPFKKDILLELPGVGEYKANAILCFGYGKPRSIVDVNTAKVSSRVLDFDYDNPPQRDNIVIDNLNKVVPENNAQLFNYALIDLSHLICEKEAPKCKDCPLNQICCFYLQNKKEDV